MERPLKVVPGKYESLLNAVWIDAADVTKAKLMSDGILRLTVKGEPSPGTIDVDDRGLIKEALTILGIVEESPADDADMPGV